MYVPLLFTLLSGTLPVVLGVPGFPLLGSYFGTTRNASYDYIVVGGGTAGLTIASRLAEDGRYSVAVVEAGSFYELGNSNQSQVPAYAGLSLGPREEDINPAIDWEFFTTPQEGLNNRSVYIPAGRTLGGSSARNLFVYQRGTVQTYDKWAELVDDSSYAWDSFLPFFQRSVDFSPPRDSRAANATPLYDAPALGEENGPLSVTYPPFAWPFSSWAARALEEVGVPSQNGFNSGSLNGSSYFLYTQAAKDGIRESSETSFLRKVGLQSERLVVYQSTLAKRVVFDAERTATGVEVEVGGRSFTLTANREVVVSAGAYQSPHLLMVSGVGPASSLQRHGIEVVVDRSGVGQNMWDHILGGPSYRVGLVTGSQLADLEFAAAATNDFIQSRTGPLTVGVGDFLAWEKVPESLRENLSQDARSTLSSEFPPDWPELEDVALSVYWGNLNGTIPPPSAGNFASILVALVAPLSRGTVDIASPDMADPPLIDPRWLTHPVDQEVAIAAFKRARTVFETEALAPVRIGEEYYPGPQIQSDQEILEHIRGSFGTVYHPACTCAMGKADDAMAVVDSHARVFGVHGLRVVDASAFPLLPPGHPQATVYALAEKIAADILEVD